MRLLPALALVVLAGCKIPPPDNTETLKALIEDGKQRSLPEVARSVQSVATELPTDVQPYRLGVDDMLTVRVVGHPEFAVMGQTTSGDEVGVRVQQDGNVYLPLVDGVPAAGKTPVEFRAALLEQLKRFLKEPSATVEVLRYESQRFHLLGAVRAPGTYPVNGQTHLLDALGNAGGITDGADLRGAYVLREQTLLPVSFYDLLQRGDIRQNIQLRDKDFIYVPVAKEGAVYVLGQVKLPGRVGMTPQGLNLASAMAAAGDIDYTYAEKFDVTIFRGDFATPKAFRISVYDVYKYGASIQLQPHDRIVVAERGLGTWARTMQLLIPFLNTPVTTVATQGLVR